MRKLFIAAALSLISVSAFADVYVNPYVRSDGTMVQGHYRSDSDGQFDNNWSSSPNINPYTGKRGSLYQ